MKIYVFGNSLVKEDSLPIKLIPQMQKKFPKIHFIIADPNENFPPSGEKDLIILDTVMGLKKPKIFTLADLETIAKSPVSPHDYDLGMHFLLLKKIKRINTVKIIGVPSMLVNENLVEVYRCIDTTIHLFPPNFKKVRSAGHTGVKSPY